MSSLTFTLVQTALHWEDKKANLQMLEEKIAHHQQKMQVVILPEMFSTGFSMKSELLAEAMDGETVQWMKRVAANHKIIITGSVIIKESTSSFYNRAIWMLPTGEYGSYNKRHLFAFAEEDKHYTAGTERFIASVNGWKINVQVCYDLRFPVWARQNTFTASGKQNLNGEEAFEYDVLIFVANWPERRSLAWKTLLQARAIENQCYVIGVNRVGNDGNGIYHNGDSMVINPLGEILYHKEKDEELFTITLNKDDLLQIREKFQFWRDADQFNILI